MGTLELEDIVLDTNVLVHSNSPNSDKFDAAVELVGDLMDSRTSICFDEGAHPKEANSRSRILSEYWKNVPGNSLAGQLLARLFQTQRWRNVSSTIQERHARVINQNVPDRSDRVFARVAMNSLEKRLVTHDSTAFHGPCKRKLKSKCDIVVCAASEVPRT